MVWRRRYFVLHNGMLYYYEMFLKGCLSLAEGAGLAANAKEATITDAEAYVPSSPPPDQLVLSRL